MQAGDITPGEYGVVRVHGEAQGYFALPVRHILLNDKVNGPNTPAMETWWFPTPDDVRRMLAGRPVCVRILGSIPPPMTVYVEPA